MIVAVDTNVLGYAEGLDDAARQTQALKVMTPIGPERLVVPAQVLAELFSVMTRKTTQRGTAQQAVMRWAALAEVVAITGNVVAAAADLAAMHRLQIFDAIILAAAAAARADLLLSEDMQDGFAWRGMTVVNPFSATPHPLLAALLR